MLQIILLCGAYSTHAWASIPPPSSHGAQRPTGCEQSGGPGFNCRQTKEIAQELLATTLETDVRSEMTGERLGLIGGSVDHLGDTEADDQPQRRKGK